MERNLQRVELSSKSEKVADILLVEDDVELARAIAVELRRDFYNVTTVHDGKSAIGILDNQNFDIVLLDLMLPDISGFSVCESLIAMRPNLGLIMITALGSLPHTLRGLEAGADDYLVKPFGVAELRARVHAVLRRRSELSTWDGVEEKRIHVTLVQSGGMVFHLTAKGVMCDGKMLDIGNRQEELLRLLLRAPGVVLTRKYVERYFQERTRAVTSATVDWYVHELRNALNHQIGDGLVETVHGLGWRVRAPREGS
ncbi:MAG: response regulator transcription factor [Actinomycetota bacterium]|nr:response regulator transcription factor [Actinomycetota bacterium]